ncbi:unnamed protein product [Spodoptera littoralis]|uniref:Gustatory receptor n=1 Tax=Spodoptera littoralis TaxID=7109 RepID=A0A9P0I6Y9_SPOLI|nr:unnamed protein product [Spodoptera littoralis]CAH1640555.1 unnamed protein product [Spodoptera littoralis]
MYLYCMFFETKRNGGEETFEHLVLDIYDYTLVSIGGFINLFTNIKQKYNNVLYVLKIQNVHRILKLNERCFKRSIIANWICVLAINCFHISWTLIYFFTFNDFHYSLLTFSCLTWVMKNLVIITFLCVECEKYYSAMKDVKRTCSQMTTSERSSANQKRFCKNILRVQDATFNKLRVCGLFAVDASLPLRVVAFITTYTIIQLQFVFL